MIKSKILPWVQILPTAHFVLMESCWGAPSPNPANMKPGKQHDLGHVLPGFSILSYWSALWGGPFALALFVVVVNHNVEQVAEAADVEHKGKNHENPSTY